MKRVVTYPKSIQFLSLTLFLIVVLMPFHAFFTTWIGSNTGGLLAWRAWKELLLVPMGLVSFYVIMKDKALQKELFTDRLMQLMLVFIFWQIFVAALHSRQFEPLALGLAIQLRIIFIFLLARVVAYYKPPKTEFLEKLVLIPAVGVVVFALLQIFILPYDFLKHFGYQKNVTIPPYFTIDEQLSKLRYSSTLRGPNPLGTYLILPIILLLQKIWARTKPQLVYIGIALVASVALYGSHSRGAWIGLIAALIIWLALILPKRLRLIGQGGMIILCLFAAGFVYQQRNSTFVQDIILHDNPQTGGAVSSNAGHIDSIKAAVDDVQDEPLFGCGPGCAGPASAHNKSGTRFAENYFLQTAQESGLIGLGLLLAVLGLVAYRLLQKTDPFSRVLLAAFVGINIASLFSHAWADDTIAYVWWGLAGLVLGSPIITTSKNVKKS